MGLFSRRRESVNTNPKPQGGKYYRLVNTCAIVGLFVAVGVLVFMITGVIPWTSNLVGIIAAIAIICFSCLLALPWVRKIENNEFKILSYVFLGIVGLSCVLWLISDIVVVSEYKTIMASTKVELTEEENLKLVGSLLRTINFLKASVLISIQFSVASFIATGITKYRKTMIPFQAIAYASYLFCDIWFTSFLFTVNINSNVSAIVAEGSENMFDKIFTINENLFITLTSRVMLTIFALAIAYVIISNAIIKRQEQTRVKHTAEDIAYGRVSTTVEPAKAEPATVESAEEKLAKLKRMFDNELISKEEYEAKKDEILKDM